MPRQPYYQNFNVLRLVTEMIDALKCALNFYTGGVQSYQDSGTKVFQQMPRQSRYVFASAPKTNLFYTQHLFRIIVHQRSIEYPSSSNDSNIYLMLPR
ncbi:hypothetical protein TNIN_361371 [Trichonephila inaurata madagascariensis]|uniref:Uncharacterized protein n=1 Tax=Trichonephila inaurata madagascariensis TaxID=2747483 RepID=A0A8X6YIC5_9ARAC|nr:hypothetical protein TNIN_361371 [Trichonephila inaurata madagascariensis]